MSIFQNLQEDHKLIHHYMYICNLYSLIWKAQPYFNILYRFIWYISRQWPQYKRRQQKIVQ